MRNILSDLESGKLLSDPDPVRRARNQMKSSLPRRFYEHADAARTEDGVYAIHLDGKPVRTPGRALLALPTEAAARLVAGEFDAQGETIDPVTMPVLRLVNTAIDGVASDPQAVIEDVMRFSSSDLLCYRADGPAELVERQAEAWDPWIDWARVKLGARLYLAEGVVPVEQQREAIGAVGIHLQLRGDPLRLAAIHVMTALTGSALLALAVEAGDLDAEEAWRLAHVDEDWNIAQWGEDDEAKTRRALRHRDMMAAARLLEALGKA